MRILGIALLALFVSSAAHAHVRVAPTEAAAGARQEYIVRVPTEGMVTTTGVELLIPAGVHVIVADGDAKLQKAGEHVSMITWTVAIPPGESRELRFTAMNPSAAGTLEWKAHQFYSDGTRTDWVGPRESRRPASVTTIGAAR